MFIRRALAVSLLLCGLLCPSGANAQLEFPKPTGWINDFANVIGAKDKKLMAAICAEVDKKTRAQIAVVTIDTIGATPVGDYAHLLFNKWGIGHKEDNRGMLVLLAIKDHKYTSRLDVDLKLYFPISESPGLGLRWFPI